MGHPRAGAPAVAVADPAALVKGRVDSEAAATAAREAVAAVASEAVAGVADSAAAEAEDHAAAVAAGTGVADSADRPDRVPGISGAARGSAPAVGAGRVR